MSCKSLINVKTELNRMIRVKRSAYCVKVAEDVGGVAGVCGCCCGGGLSSKSFSAAAGLDTAGLDKKGEVVVKWIRQ